MTAPEWRARHRVLVADAQTIGALGVIRSLGRAGYPVLACAPDPQAIGFRSRFAQACLTHPPYDDADAVVRWLRHAIAAHGVELVIPSERLLLALRPVFEHIKDRLPLARDAERVYRGMSKFDLFAAFDHAGAPARLRAHLPPYLLIDQADEPNLAACAALGPRVFIKGDACDSKVENDFAGRVEGVPQTEIGPALARLRSRYRRLLLQGFVPGVGVGVFFLRWQKTLLAHFMHRRLHEVPPEGGVSSLRSSFWHQAIHDDARMRMDHLDWEGVAMFEYRWNPATDAFHLIEMNARFWGSLHLALYAGVDFPRLLADAFFGRPERSSRFRVGVRSRLTFPGEVSYVLSSLRERRLSWRQRLATIPEFARLSLNPCVKSDLLFPRDRGVYWLMLARSLKQFMRVRSSS